MGLLDLSWSTESVFVYLASSGEALEDEPQGTSAQLMYNKTFCAETSPPDVLSRATAGVVKPHPDVSRGVRQNIRLTDMTPS